MKLYKDREPKETIKILTDYFTGMGYTLEKILLGPTMVNTYGVKLNLYYDNIQLESSNGKGLTPEAAEASALGEMYERWCNKILVQQNPICWDNCYENNGYYIFENEKPINKQDYLNNPIISRFLTKVGNNSDIIIDKLIYYLCGGHYIGTPYKNILTDEIRYTDSRFIVKANTSTGMAAGNSFQEAFCQGLSEIFERYTAQNFFGFNGTFERINPESLPLELKERYNIINTASHYKFNLYNCYNVNGFPVVSGVLVNTKQYRTVTYFGCFPIIEVAIERVITELFQNVYNADDFYTPQIPAKGVEGKTVYQSHFQSAYRMVAYIPDSIFTNYITVNMDECKGFYKGDNIYEFYTNFLKENNLHTWCADVSNLKNMVALHIYIDELVLFDNVNRFVDFTPIDYDHAFLMLDYLKAYGESLKEDKIDRAALLGLFLGIQFQHALEHIYTISVLTFSNWLSPLNEMDTALLPSTQSKLLPNSFNGIGLYNDFEDSNYQQNIGKYLFLLTLLSQPEESKYSYDEIISLAKNYNIVITHKELDELFDTYNLIYYMFIKWDYDILHSDWYSNYITNMGRTV